MTSYVSEKKIPRNSEISEPSYGESNGKVQQESESRAMSWTRNRATMQELFMAKWMQLRVSNREKYSEHFRTGSAGSSSLPRFFLGCTSLVWPARADTGKEGTT